MDSGTWDRLADLFFEAIEVPTEERAAFLDRACGDDRALRQEIEGVLAGHDAATRARRQAGGSSELEPPRAPGDRVGAFAIDSLLGRGGMGEVYLARRADDQYEQRVAIKLIRPDRDLSTLVRRFQTERQVLARLQHPNIATLLDGGVTEDARPYLVMQYVEGKPLTTYAQEHALSLRERLRLFLTVCDAVQFAHANLVVHRDLKPSNILVTEEGDVRLLDFGIAKLLDADPWAGSNTGDLLLLTPEHAAPEQFLGEPITIATDVYALGILLYELLTGSRPYQFVSPLELHRAICERDPLPPATAATDPERLQRLHLAQPPVAPGKIRGDLDCIVLKTLRKEPERRYASVADLATDVRRFLQGFPVEARPESFGYVAIRFLQRHRAAVGASLALATSLAALAVVSARYATTSRAQARAIAEERDVAVEVSSFLETLFRAPDPFALGAERRDTMRIRTFLAEGAAKVMDDLADRPRVQARLLTSLGGAQMEIGQLDDAIPLLERAEALTRETTALDARETGAIRRQLSTAYWQKGRAAESEALLRSADSIFASDSAAMLRERVLTLNGLGTALQVQGQQAEAETVYRHALALAQVGMAPDDPELATTLSNLGAALHRAARFAEADSVLRRALELDRARLGPDHPRVAVRMTMLASMLIDWNRLDEAIRINREAVAMLRASLPDPHPRLAAVINNLSVALVRTGDLQEGEALTREALRMQRELYGNENPLLASTLTNLGVILDMQGRREEAIALHRESLGLIEAAAGPDHPQAAYSHNNIGMSFHALGRHREALAEFERTLSIRQQKIGADHPLTANAEYKVGGCLMDLGRFAEAEPHLLESLRVFEPLRAQEAESWNQLLGQLVRYYRASGKPAEAERYAALRTPPSS
ncbi:MAG: serine/threonine-protein kinase [Gemmatimonadota bacterium]